MDYAPTITPHNASTMLSVWSDGEIPSPHIVLSFCHITGIKISHSDIKLLQFTNDTTAVAETKKHIWTLNFPQVNSLGFKFPTPPQVLLLARYSNINFLSSHSPVQRTLSKLQYLQLMQPSGIAFLRLSLFLQLFSLMMRQNNKSLVTKRNAVKKRPQKCRLH